MMKYPNVETLRQYIGRWVAIKGGEVIYSHIELTEIIEYLKENDIKVDTTMYIPKENGR